MSLASRAVYPSQSAPLRQHLESLLREAQPPDLDGGTLIGLIVPDSNRLSGGPAAAEAYALLRDVELDTAIVVSPSHSGEFGRLSVCKVDTYQTPLGDIDINDHLRNELCDEDDDIFLDDTGHYHTEGADVQLPFLQSILGEDFNTVPIVMGEESPVFCRELGRAVGEVLYGKRAIMVGTADVIEGEEAPLERLRAAIESFNVSELFHLMGSEAVTMEGMGAIATEMLASQERGATHARVLALAGPEDGSPGPIACAFWRA
ncbi:MAG: AmmeMemoRadiSam system protein B [Bacteroidota bacterium]